MMTVGELVADALGVVTDWNDRPGDRRGDLEWRNVLRSLGIWDTEVLEGKFLPDEWDTLGLFRIGSERENDWVLDGFVDGQKVRVIVLKEAE